MSKTVKGYSALPKAVERRKSVIVRLEKQLVNNTKPALIDNDGSATWTNVPLEESDVKRIKKELEILKTRI